MTDVCTACNPELLFSHRASGEKKGKSGRFLRLTGIKNPLYGERKIPVRRIFLLDSVQCVGDIGDEILFVFQAQADADQLCGNACLDELFVGHLAVRGGGGIQTAGSGVSHMSLDGSES